MISIITRLRLKNLLFARFWLIALIIWIAIPEVSDNSLAGDAELHPQILKPRLQQVGYAKQEQGNTIVKQLIIIPCVRALTIFRFIPKLRKTHINISHSIFNAFYVHTTTNAP